MKYTCVLKNEMKRHYFRMLYTFLMKTHKLRKIKVPLKQETLELLPLNQHSSEIQLDTMLPSYIPKLEKTKVKNAMACAIRKLSQVFISRTQVNNGVPINESEQTLFLKYAPKNRATKNVIEFTEKPKCLKDDIDLGQLVTENPFFLCLEKVTDDCYKVDMIKMGKYRTYDNLKDLGCVAYFKKTHADVLVLDAIYTDKNEKLECTRKNKKLVICAMLNYLTIVYHFSWIHLHMSTSLSVGVYNMNYNHPLRLFLHPFIYGSINTNSVLGLNLFVSKGAMESITSYPNLELYNIINDDMKNFNIENMDPRKIFKNSGKFSYTSQIYLQYFNIVYDAVSSIIQILYKSNSELCLDNDVQILIQSIANKMNSYCPVISKLENKLTKIKLINVLSVFIVNISVGHEIVGTSFLPFVLFPYECATRAYTDDSDLRSDVYQQTINSILVATLLSPNLLMNYSYLFEYYSGEYKDEMIEVVDNLQKEFVKLQEQITHDNVEERQKLYPIDMSTSTST